MSHFHSSEKMQSRAWNAVFVIIALGLFITPTLNAACAQGEAQSSTEIPDEVTSYVDAQNFVAAFSRPHERRTLVQHENSESVWRETG